MTTPGLPTAATLPAGRPQQAPMPAPASAARTGLAADRRATRARWRRSALALLVLTVLPACSGVPSTGPAQDVESIGIGRAPAQSDAPRPGLLPEDVVREFVAKATDTQQDLPGQQLQAARQYLTAEAARTWQQGDPTSVVIIRNDYRTNLVGNEVEVTGVQTGALDAVQAYSVVADRAYQYRFSLRREQGEWRIDNPPDDLVVTQSGFGADYRERVVYFLDPTGTVLVPELRHVTTTASATTRAARLVALLLNGPSGALAGRVSTLLPPSAKLLSNVSIDDKDNVQIDLTGVDLPSLQARQALGAQLAYTLSSEGAGVVVQVDGQPLDPETPVFTTANSAAFSPDTTPGTGNFPQDPYYIDNDGRIISLDTGQSMWGTWGRSGSVVAAAMSAANGTVAAVSRSADGDDLLIGRPLEFQPAVGVLRAGRLTAPSFDRSGSTVWVVQDGGTKPRITQLTLGTQVTRQSVQAPELAKLGPVTALVRSPDGVRVAIVADARLYVGVIQTTRAGPESQPSITLTGLTEVDPQLTDVGPVTFVTATRIAVGARLAGSSPTGFRVVYQVSIDGQQQLQITDEEIFDDVTAIAVSSGTWLTAFGGRVLKLSGQPVNGSWISPDPQKSAVTGSSPFVPR